MLPVGKEALSEELKGEMKVFWLAGRVQECDPVTAWTQFGPFSSHSTNALTLLLFKLTLADIAHLLLYDLMRPLCPALLPFKTGSRAFVTLNLKKRENPRHPTEKQKQIDLENLKGLCVLW